MINYAVDTNILLRYLPPHTEIDLWNNTCFVSLVGFMFLNTKLLGYKIPFHVNFEEVNLRFYVRYRDITEWKRGVVFIKEIVPKPALSFVANSIYKENYETLPMKHSWILENGTLKVAYSWKKFGWNKIEAIANSKSMEIVDGSEAEFITEHYWGYTKLSDTRTSEYGVEHPKWDIYEVQEFNLDINFGKVYGDNFSFLQDSIPVSVFLAEGSEIKVNSKRNL